MALGRDRRPRIGILDHTGWSFGGGQLVVGHMAAALSVDHRVDLIHPGAGYTLERLRDAFHLELGAVNERTPSALPTSFAAGGATGDRLLSGPYDLFVYVGHGVPPTCHARRGLVYSHFPVESSLDRHFSAGPQWNRRGPVSRRARRWAYRLLWRLRIRRYRKILANSSFTARWIERRWGIPAEVLYPPVELEEAGVGAAKQNVIVSVGRFSGRGRSKNQLEQVIAFRRFLSKTSEAWHLRLIGFCSDATEDRTYLETVREAAGTLPVTFFVNGDREAVSRSLMEAKVFWHTAGLAVDGDKCPQVLEHFGIATVEAMQAGCVPVVIDSGGQREIVDNGVNGFLCRDLDELVSRSAGLIAEDSGRLLARMQQEAERKGHVFARATFHEKIRRVASECLR